MDKNNGPDLSALAADMLKWEQKKRELDELEQAIKDTVMQIGKTQTVGNVRATFSNGRKSYDYQRAVESYAAQGLFVDDALAKHSKTVYDYKAICAELLIVAVPFTQSPPSVSLKLMT